MWQKPIDFSHVVGYYYHVVNKRLHETTGSANCYHHTQPTRAGRCPGESEEVNMVQNYAEWKEAVEKEYSRLSDVIDYLNYSGMERLRVFRTLSEMAEFNQSAADLLEDIRTSAKRVDVKKMMESFHAGRALKTLEKIAENTPT